MGVCQINSRWSTFPLHWIHSRLSFHIIYNKFLAILYNNPEIPWYTHLKSIGTSISVKQQDEKPGHPILSGDESWFPVIEWRGKPSFQSGQTGIHSTWGSKLRVPLTYLLLREGSSWGACGKLAYHFSQIQGIILILRWYGVHRTFLIWLYCNWWSSILERGISINHWSFLKGV